MKHAAPTPRRVRPAFLAAAAVAFAVAIPSVVNAAGTTITRADAQAAADTIAAYLAQPEPTLTVTEAGPTVTVTASPTTSPSGPGPSSTPTSSPSASATSTPTPTPSGSIGGLAYAPPVLTNPVTIQIAASGGTYSAPSTTDCLIVAPQLITGPVTLNGCDDRVWTGGVFGGRTTIPTGSYDSANRGIRLSDVGSSATGTDYLAGLWFRPGTYLSDAIQIAHRTTSRTVVLTDIRVDAWTWGTKGGVHGDTLQCWGGPAELHVYGLTALRSTYQGVYCDAADGRTLPTRRGAWTFDRVNIVGVNTAEQARYMFADREPAFTRAVATDVWISGSPYNNADGFGNAPAGVKVGTVADFVPASKWVSGTYVG